MGPSIIKTQRMLRPTRVLPRTPVNKPLDQSPSVITTTPPGCAAPLLIRHFTQRNFAAPLDSHPRQQRAAFEFMEEESARPVRLMNFVSEEQVTSLVNPRSRRRGLLRRTACEVSFRGSWSLRLMFLAFSNLNFAVGGIEEIEGREG